MMRPDVPDAEEGQGEHAEVDDGEQAPLVGAPAEREPWLSREPGERR